MSKTKELQPWQGYLFLGVIFVAIVLGIVQFATNQRAEDSIDSPSQVLLTEATCDASGGTWNACGSACRGQDDEAACIAMCVQYCECTSDLQCPYGFTCSDYVEEIGVCTNTF